MIGQKLSALGEFSPESYGVRAVAEMMNRLDSSSSRDIAQRRSQAENAVEEQRRVMLEARQRLRLLEKLKQRHYAEWSAAASGELEETASECTC